MKRRRCFLQHPADVIVVEDHDHPPAGDDQLDWSAAELRTQPLQPHRRAFAGLDSLQELQYRWPPGDHATGDECCTQIQQRRDGSSSGQAIR